MNIPEDIAVNAKKNIFGDIVVNAKKNIFYFTIAKIKKMKIECINDISSFETNTICLWAMNL